MPRGVYNRENHRIEKEQEEHIKKSQMEYLENRNKIAETERLEALQEVTELKEEVKMLEREVSRLTSIIIEAIKGD